MVLPAYISLALQRLEDAGYSSWVVGGCVRDHLLGLTPQDYDLCTGATPEQIKGVFSDCQLVLAGEKHGTVGVVTEDSVVEITTFRTEGDYADNRHPGWVEFVTDLESDLARRDFTVNAIAYSPSRGYADPFGGQKDLENRILRAVGDPALRFAEDSLRILRGARFAAKYNLTPEAETAKAMVELAPLMDNLAKERVFSELCKLLLWADAEDLLRFAPVISQAIPELRPAVGFDQRSPHHRYDVYTHIAHVVAATPRELPLRWAALLHDVGKVPAFSQDETGRGHFYGHAQIGAQMADSILLELRAPTALRQQVTMLIEKHMTKIEPDRKVLRRWISRLGLENLEQLLKLQEADTGSKGDPRPEEMAQFAQIWQLLAQIRQEDGCLSLKDLAVNGHDLMALGLSGTQIGDALNFLLEQVLDEKLPNEKAALLQAIMRR